MKPRDDGYRNLPLITVPAASPSTQNSSRTGVMLASRVEGREEEKEERGPPEMREKRGNEVDE